MAYLSQSAPSSNDKIYGTPGGASDVSPQDVFDLGNYDHDPAGIYDMNRRELPVFNQANGWEPHPKPRTAAINGHIGRLETLSERLQRFQMSDQNFNGEYFGQASLGAHRQDKGYTLSADDDMLGPEQLTAGNRPNQSPNLASSVKDVGANSPAGKRRTNGIVDPEKVNGLSAPKPVQRGRHAQSTSPNRFQDQKEKNAEPAARKQNGVHHSNGHGGNSPATANQTGWQTTRKKHRKGSKAPTLSNGGEPLPADESLRKGG
jgi:hypothetical protein